MWTKLRPGVREFLDAVHRRYELHIYTMGDRDYAAEMARRLDPQRRLFAERIISSVRLNTSESGLGLAELVTASDPWRQSKRL
jgi:TFIIF-interacting CTD phosphatase-like protein